MQSQKLSAVFPIGNALAVGGLIWAETQMDRIRMGYGSMDHSQMVQDAHCDHGVTSDDPVIAAYHAGQ